MSDTPSTLPLNRAVDLRTAGSESRSGLTHQTPGPHHPSADEAGPARFTLDNLYGRLIELSAWRGGASLTVASGLILEAQLGGELVAWIACGESSFYPPDLAGCGIDLAALAVVRVGDPRAAARAADKLARSGAFGLIILDLVGSGPRVFVPPPLQSRLLALAGKHGVAVLFLTSKKLDAPSLSSLISLRAQAQRRRTQEGRFACDVEIVKDKRHGPRRSYPEVHHGPAGLH